MLPRDPPAGAGEPGPLTPSDDRAPSRGGRRCSSRRRRRRQPADRQRPRRPRRPIALSPDRPSTTGAHHPCRSHTRNSFARPAPDPRNHARRSRRPPRRGATVLVDVREASEWEQGHIPGAVHIPQELYRAADRGGGPRPRRARSSCTAPAASARCRGPDPRADGLHQRRVDDAAASRPGRRAGCRGRPGRPDRRAEAALQPPSPDPRGRHRRPGQAARLEGPARRRRRSRAPGGAVPRGGRRRHDRDRRLRHGRPVEPAAPGPPHDDRIGEKKVESARQTIEAPQPRREGRRPRGDARRRQRRADHRRLRRDPRRHRHVRDPLPPERRGRRREHPRGPRRRCSGSRAS